MLLDPDPDLYFCKGFFNSLIDKSVNIIYKKNLLQHGLFEGRVNFSGR